MQAKHWRWKINWKSSSLLLSTNFIPNFSLSYVRMGFLNMISVTLKESNTVCTWPFSPSGCLEYGSCQQDEWAVREDVDMLLRGSLTCRKCCRCLWSESNDEQAGEMHPGSKWLKLYLGMKKEQMLLSHSKLLQFGMGSYTFVMEKKQWVSAPFLFPWWLCISEKIFFIGF